MFRIKICGITNANDVQAAADAGADAIGLNFYENSPRRVTIEQSRNIIASCDLRVRVRAGVFVNADPARIHEMVTQAGLSAIQLHGDESPEIVAQIARAKQSTDPDRTTPIIRARRIGDHGVADLASDLEACRATGVRLGAVLVDSAISGRYGGTGKAACWAQLADYKDWPAEPPLILAGGLTPENVAEAIRIVRPYGVDVASGVESSPGKKDAAKMRDFVAAAREAMAAFQVPSA